jgi:hypothetical protein
MNLVDNHCDTDDSEGWNKEARAGSDQCPVSGVLAAAQFERFRGTACHRTLERTIKGSTLCHQCDQREEMQQDQKTHSR